MGYTTEFQGEFKITPPLSKEEVDSLNFFCQERHERNGPMAFPGIWCDWEFHNTDDCTLMYWNGSEKSYNMTRWAVYLQNNFFSDHDVEGRIRARGENFDDVWTMVADPVDCKIYEIGGWD